MPLLRLFFVILLIANLVLFTLGRGGMGSTPEGEAGRMAKQITPEKLRLVTEKPAMASASAPAAALPAAPDAAPPTPEPKPAEVPKAAEAKAPEKSEPKPVEKPAPAKAEEKPAPKPVDKSPVCRTVPTLTGEQSAKALTLLKSASATVKTSFKELAPDGPSAWWVNLPPQPDRAAADARVAELKEKGIQEFFIVQEDGPNKYAVSLGLYKQEKGAKEYLAKLKKAGVSQARITPRGGEARRDLTLRGPADAVDAAIARLNSGLGELRVVTCK